MQLRSVSFNHYRGFSRRTTLLFDPHVTTLVGANDSGKSSVLALLDAMFTTRRVEMRDHNDAHIAQFGGQAPTKKPIQASAVFEITDPQLAEPLVGQGFVAHVRRGDEVKVLVPLRGNVNQAVHFTVQRDGRDTEFKGEVGKLPRIVRLHQTDPVRHLVDTNALKTAETAFINTLFPEGNPAGSLSADPRSRRRRLEQAEQTARERFAWLGNIVDGLEISLRLDADQANLRVEFFDGVGGLTPLAWRGTGVQKAFAIILQLLSQVSDKEHILVLADEPENSLHANTQVFLRTALEKMAARERVQVIYATHSPCFINNMRPHAIRLFRRVRHEGRATSEVVDSGYQNNFEPVRRSLGMSPADSLLFGSITVVVDGDTEVLCLPDILKKMYEGGERPDIETVLSEIHVLDGRGGNFEHRIRVARWQGGRAILFLDGDTNRAQLERVVKEHGDEVPVVLLGEDREFEDLFTNSAPYFAALAEVLDDASLTLEAFERWKRNNPNETNAGLSKRVRAWIRRGFPKPIVMRLALQKATLDDIDVGPIDELVAHVRRMLAHL